MMSVQNLKSEAHASLAGNNVVLTGASGFIGTHLCTRLLEQGAVVHAFVRSRRIHDLAKVHWWEVDLTQSNAVKEALDAIKPSTIFHLAGHPVGARALEEVIPSFRDNLMGTVNILSSAATSGSRVLLSGSLEEPNSGDPDAFPSSPYAASKWAGSAYARMFHALFGLPIVILRVFMVYGPGQHDGTKLIPYTINSLLRGASPKLSSGARRVDWIFVEDVVEGFLAAAKTKGIEGQTIDLGFGTLASIRTVVEKLVELTDPAITPLFGALPERPFEQERVADVAKSFSLLGWKPKVDLDRGLDLTVRWYKARVLGAHRTS